MEEILDLMKQMELDQKNLKHELYKLCWYMRGSVSADEAFTMCIEDREILNQIIKENLETAKQIKQPFW